MRLASKVGDGKTRLGVLGHRVDSAVENVLGGKLKSLNICMAKLDALSPLKVLGRGFAIAENEAGEILRDAAQVAVDDLVRIRLAEGSFKARVEKG
jgi:exodeoxyribonuclease VII large subunit